MDPIASALEDEQAAADAVKLQAANASIVNVVDAGIALVRGAGAQVEASVISDALYGAMADALAGLSDDEGETLDLTEVDDLGAILESAVESLTLDDAQQALIDAAVADVAAALRAVNQRIDDAAERFVDGRTSRGDDALSDIARLQTVAQADLREDISSLVASEATAVLDARYAGSALTRKVDGADAGSLTPDQPITSGSSISNYDPPVRSTADRTAPSINNFEVVDATTLSLTSDESGTAVLEAEDGTELAQVDLTANTAATLDINAQNTATVARLTVADSAGNQTTAETGVVLGSNGEDNRTQFDDTPESLFWIGFDGDDDLVTLDSGDILDGGQGTDTLFPLSIGNETVTFDSDASIQNVEEISSIVGNSIDVDLSSQTEGFTIRVLNGDDVIRGSHGNDLFDVEVEENQELTSGLKLEGAAGDDEFTIRFQANFLLNDSTPTTIDGGEGQDTLVFVDYDGTTKGSATANVLDLDDFDGSTYNGDADAFDNFSNLENVDLSDEDSVSYTLRGTAGTNILTGGGGDDDINAGPGHDTINGGAGADRIQGRRGDDIINGGAGGDTITGNAGADTIDGGAGADTYTAGNGTAISVTLNTDTAATVTVIDGEDDSIVNIENVIGTDGADTITGDTADNMITGGAGDDTITGGAGADTLGGGIGNNTFVFNTGDAVAGETVAFNGIDTFDVESETDFSELNDGAALTGLDTVEVAGGGTAVTFTGSQLSGETVTVNGSGISPDEVLIVIATDNAGQTIDLSNLTLDQGLVSEVNGEAGDDTLMGSDGDDTITGGAGADRLTGGDGTDTFAYTAADGGETEEATVSSGSAGGVEEADVITDLSIGDTVELYDAAGLSDDFYTVDGTITNSSTAGDVALVSGVYSAADDSFTQGAASDTNDDLLLQWGDDTNVKSVVLDGDFFDADKRDDVAIQLSGLSADATLTVESAFDPDSNFA